MKALAARTYVALLHAPVLNRAGEEVTTAVTNLDVHDIARSSLTYGLAGYVIVTPISLQQELVRTIAGHWKRRSKASDGPRRQALERVTVAPDLATVVERVTAAHGRAPQVAVTAARPAPGTVDGQRWIGQQAGESVPIILAFGTGWGLAPAALAAADVRLDPIWGPTDYNHLSVRSAVAIYLDRLFGASDPQT